MVSTIAAHPYALACRGMVADLCQQCGDGKVGTARECGSPALAGGGAGVLRRCIAQALNSGNRDPQISIREE
jgi:hypothetical protein